MADMFEEIKVALSEPQSKKVVRGGSIQLARDQMGVGSAVKVKKANAVKLRRAMNKGKGARLKLDPEELAVNGEGLFDVLKKGWKALKKSGLARKALKTAAKVALPAIATAVGGPGAGAKVAGVTAKYADQAVDALGNVAGFGMKAPKGRGPRGIQTNRSTLLSSANTSMHPKTDAMPDQSVARFFPRGMAKNAMLPMSSGEGFRPSGGGFMPAGYRR